MQKVTFTPVVLVHIGLHLWKPFLLFFAICPPSVHMGLALLLHREHWIMFCWIAFWDILPLGKGWGIRVIVRWAEVVWGRLGGKRQIKSAWQYIQCFANFAQALISNSAPLVSLLTFVHLCTENLHVCGSSNPFPYLPVFSHSESNICRLTYDPFLFNGYKQSFPIEVSGETFASLWNSK